MSHNPASELASAIQSAHIVRHPSPAHDVNPSTAASKLIPIDEISPSPTLSDIDHDHDNDVSGEEETSSIPSDILRPLDHDGPDLRARPRRKQLAPPLPDMRFEQSYLASIKDAETNTQIAVITVRDQILLPLVQGVMWNLVLSGWRFWNRGTKFQGTSIGARVRKWWWGVNGWKLPAMGADGAVAGAGIQAANGRWRSQKG